MKPSAVSAQRTLAQMLVAGAVLGVVGAVVARWATAVALSGMLDLYRIAVGICSRDLSLSDEHLLGLIAIGITSVLGAGIARGTFCSVRLWWRTRRLVIRLLARRIDRPPSDLSDAAAAVAFHDMVDVVRDDRPQAFCYGLCRPRVCISTGLVRLLAPAELDAVLLHEHYHRRRHEPLRILVAEAVANTFYFVPLLQDLRWRYTALKEIEADRAAVAAHGGAAPLAGALYKILNQVGADGHRAALLIGGISPTAQRIDYLLAPDASALVPVSRVRLLVSLAGGTLMLALVPLLASPHLLLSLTNCPV